MPGPGRTCARARAPREGSPGPGLRPRGRRPRGPRDARTERQGLPRRRVSRRPGVARRALRPAAAPLGLLPNHKWNLSCPRGCSNLRHGQIIAPMTSPVFLGAPLNNLAQKLTTWEVRMLSRITRSSRCLHVRLSSSEA